MGIALLNKDKIHITGNETFANLVQFIKDNQGIATADGPVGSVDGLIITLLRHLDFASNATFTSEDNVTYNFGGSAQLRCESDFSGVILNFASNNTLVYQGTAKNHENKMKGNVEINYNSLTFIIATIDIGRNDFSSANIAWIGTDIKMIAQFNGKCYMHFESDGLKNSNFKGDTKIKNQMTGGSLAIQFNSNSNLETKEYSSFDFSEVYNDQTDTNIFLPRVEGGAVRLNYCIFDPSNMVLIKPGEIKTEKASTFIVNPIFGNENNFGDFAKTENGENRVIEIMTFEAGTMDDNWNCVVKRDGVIVQQGLLSAIMEGFSNGEKTGILLNNRSTSTTTKAPARSHHELTFRKYGQTEVVISKVFNEPEKYNITIVEDDRTVETDKVVVGNYATAGEITAQQFVDSAVLAMAENMAVPNDALMVLGSSIIVKTGWTLEHDSTQDALTSFDVTTSKIKVNATNILKTTNLTVFKGIVSSNLDGKMGLNYVASNGKVAVTLTGIDPQDFGHNLSAVFYKEEADTDWVKKSITGDQVDLELFPSKNYDIKLYSAGYSHRQLTLNSQQFGVTFDAELQPHVDLEGNNIYDKPFNQAHHDSVSYNSTTRTALFTLESTTQQQQLDFVTVYRIIQSVTHSSELIGTFEDPIQVNNSITGFVIPSGNYLRFVKTTDTCLIFINCSINREDGTTTANGPILKKDNTPLLDGNGNEVYHFSNGISVATTVQVNSIVNQLSSNVFAEVVESIEEKIGSSERLIGIDERTTRFAEMVIDDVNPTTGETSAVLSEDALKNLDVIVETSSASTSLTDIEQACENSIVKQQNRTQPDVVVVQGFSNEIDGEYNKVDKSTLRFATGFSPQGTATSISDNTVVYANGTWYIWKRQNSGWHISQANTLGNWYWEAFETVSATNLTNISWQMTSGDVNPTTLSTSTAVENVSVSYTTTEQLNRISNATVDHPAT